MNDSGDSKDEWTLFSPNSMLSPISILKSPSVKSPYLSSSKRVPTPSSKRSSTSFIKTPITDYCHPSFDSEEDNYEESFEVLEEENKKPSLDVSIVGTVKYTTYVIDWVEGDGLNKRVSVVIHLPSGTSREQIGIKVNEDGRSLTYYEKHNALFSNANFLFKAYPDSNAEDGMNIAMGELLQKENKNVQDGKCDFIQSKMDLALPFPCEERPIQYVFDDEISDVDLFRFKAKDPHLVSKRQWYLLCYIELEGKDKHQIRASGVVNA